MDKKSVWKTLEGTTIKAARYKCLSAESPQGFERLLPINVIIGRNNSGKSSLLDLLEFGARGDPKRDLGGSPRMFFSQELSKTEIERAFPPDTSGGDIGGNFFEYGRPAIDRLLTWYVDGDVMSDVSIEPAFDLKGRGQNLAKTKGNPLAKLFFRRLAAERDIVPESAKGGVSVTMNGTGATNAVRRVLTGADWDSTLIEIGLLTDLNRIFHPDAFFERITVQQTPDSDSWEIYLHQRGKGRVPLSHSGSGLNTVLIVLLFFHVPEPKAPLHDTIFGFEELENNLHPALQRRLLGYLREQAHASGCAIVLTTHSTVAIDLFSRDADAQILHVLHDGKFAKVSTVISHAGRTTVLDDLDVRPGDVLQSNGVIWVEGPSDRVYVRMWIDLWSRGQLQEDVHYQILFYGGSLLFHLTCGSADEETEAIKVMLLNRHFAVIIDSDKGAVEDEINATKKRIKDEARRVGAIAWVTAGKEIENYIPERILTASYPLPEGTERRSVDQFTPIWDVLESWKPGEGERRKREKVALAERVVEALTLEDLKETADLAERLEEICAAIRAWNGLDVGSSG